MIVVISVLNSVKRCITPVKPKELEAMRGIALDL